MLKAVETRLQEALPQLSGRVGTAAQLADLMARNALPQQTPAAYVLPLGFRGGRPSAMAGAYTQPLEEVVGIVLTIRSHDRTGERALEDLRELLMAIMTAIAGWKPAEAVGAFVFQRGQVMAMAAGTVTYQLDFLIPTQLRIAT